MKIYDLTDEQRDLVCEYYKQRYPLLNDGDEFNYGFNCACSHCPYSESVDGYGKYWECYNYRGNYEIGTELDKMLKGEHTSRCYILSGPAGAGKSTWAQQRKEKLPGNTVIVASDDIRDEVYGGKFPGVFDKQKEKQLWEIFFQRAIEASKTADTVILDSTCLTNKKRLAWYDRLKNYFDHFTLVLINKPLEVCVEQDSRRDRHVPAKDIQKHIEMFEEPDVKIYEKFEVING